MGRTGSCLMMLGLGLLPWTGWADPDHRLSLSVVMVRAQAGPGSVAYGSGVVVGKDQVVTNCHVTRPALKITVSKGPAQFAAIRQQADTHHDLCLLTTPGIPFPAARLGSSERLRVGEPLYFYGYPRAIGIAFSQGTVRNLHPYEGGRVIETTANFTLGASGGGIFDGGGALVGLATFLAAGHAGGYYAVPSDWIEALGGRESRKIEPLRGLSFWEDAAELPAFLKPPGH